MRIGDMRIEVLKFREKVILESKGFTRVLCISPVYFHWDYSTYSCGFKAHAMFAYGICIDRQLA